MRIIGFTTASVTAAALAAVAMTTGCSQAPQPTRETPVEPAAAAAAEAATETVQDASAVEPVAEPASEPVAAPTPPPAPVVHQAAASPVAPVPARRDPAPAASPLAPAPARPVVQASAGLPSGAGRDLTQRTCTGCHGVDAITAQGRTPEGWAQIINQMQNMGLSASEEDLVQIHAYLSRNLPPR